MLSHAETGRAPANPGSRSCTLLAELCLGIRDRETATASGVVARAHALDCDVLPRHLCAAAAALAVHAALPQMDARRDIADHASRSHWLSECQSKGVS